MFEEQKGGRVGGNRMGQGTGWETTQGVRVMWSSVGHARTWDFILGTREAIGWFCTGD